MKTFHLQRNEDATGVSGTGRVAEGAVFSDGTVVLRWLTDKSSIGIYQSLAHVEQIHGHEGKTRIVFPDDERRPTWAARILRGA